MQRDVEKTILQSNDDILDISFGDTGFKSLLPQKAHYINEYSIKRIPKCNNKRDVFPDERKCERPSDDVLQNDNVI